MATSKGPDIRKIQSEASLQSDELYRATFDNAAVGIAHVGLDGRWIHFNDAVCAITGYSREELSTKTFGDITHPDDLEADWAFARRLAAGEIPTYSMEKRYCRGDGSIVWVDLTVSLLRDASGAPLHYLSVIENIDERKRIEAELRKSNDALRRSNEELRATKEQLQLVTSNMAAAVTRCSRDLRYVWVSSGYGAWLGRPADQIAGQLIRDVVGKDGYEAILPYMIRVLSGERVEYTTRVNFIGPGARWIHAVYVPTYSDSAQVDGWIAVVSDITDIIAAQEQLREANANLARANEDLERFAFVASHDLQEPLRMITAYSQLLIKSYPSQLDSEPAMFVRNIVDGTERIRDLLSDLRAYTEISSGDEIPTDTVELNRILDHVKHNLEASIRETGAIIISESLPTVQGHAAHFISLLQNLIGNALKYRSERVPRIHIRVEQIQGSFQFAVADNGIGIDPAYHAQVFEVFKRLHGKKIPGTGVGLAICQRVIERYGGRIWVESHAGQGATFFFTLPKSIAAVAAANL